MSNLALNKESLAQVYIDGLEAKLKCAENRLRELNAYYQSAQNAFNESKTWEDRIKKYWENIQRTEDLADSVVAELDKLTNQISCVCHNADQYTKAVKILICCVKDVGIVLECVTIDMRDLMARIDCGKSKEPALDSSKSILKLLEEYRTKLDAALKQSLATLQLALSLLKTAQLVLNEKRGLSDFLAYLWENGGGRAGVEYDAESLGEVDNNCFGEPNEPGPATSDCPPVNCTPIDYKKPCDPPTECDGITLELEKHSYYQTTQTQYNLARMTRIAIGHKLNEAQQVRDGAQAKRDSAFKALTDAKKAKECN